jgi:hypothetical protein
MIRTRNLTLNGTAVEASITDAIQANNDIAIQNTSPDKYAYVGNSSVTTSSYGFKLFPGQTITLELDANEKIYVCGDSGATVAILILEI